MDPIRKTGVTPGGLPKTGIEPGTRPPGEQSKFQQVRDGKTAGAEQAAADSPQAPQTPAELTRPNRDKMLADLRRKIDSSGAKTPQELFRGEMQQMQVNLDKVRKQVEAVPRRSESGPLRDKLSSIEASFANADKMLQSMSSLDSPRDLLKMQMQIYQMSQNVEILSKAVEQMSSGAKQVLQTQL
jgi:hypothetical protein